MSLLKPLLLTGVLFGAVPVIIHLLNKARYRVESFGAMMFLREAVRVRAQTIKLQQLILMLLRVLFFALLALALARPVHRPLNGSGGDQPTTHALIIDGSYSMNQGQGAENAFHRAKETALRIVDRMGKSDNMLIVWADRKPRLLSPQPVFDRDILRKQISSLEPGDGTANMPWAIEQAFWGLQNSTLPRHRVYLLTDGQETGWGPKRRASWERVAKHRQLLKVKPTVYVLVQSPDADIDSIAPVKIYATSPVIDTFRRTRFAVEIANHTPRPQTVQVRFSVDGELKAESEQRVKSGTGTVYMDHLFQEAGSHYVTAEIAQDDLTVDNTLVHAVNVMKRVPVLIIEERSSKNPWQSDGLLLRMALDAASRPGESGLFATTVASAADMDAFSAESLSQYKVVILANTVSLSEYFMFALEQFVEQGGGLLIGLGQSVVPRACNKMYKGGDGLMPGQLIDVRDCTDDLAHPTFPAGKAGFMLDAFDLTRTRVLNAVRVQKYWRCQAHENSTPLALVGDDPFLLHKAYGRGAVVLWTTSLNADWSNFPLVQDYLPLVQDLVLHLSATVEPPMNLAPGDVLLYSSLRPVTGEDAKAKPSGTSEHGISATLTFDSQAHEVPLDVAGDEWTMQWQDTSVPGLYTVATPGLPPRHFAVNPPPEESDLSPIESDDVDVLQQDLPFELVSNEAELVTLVNRETGVREWWKYFVVGAILLLCSELFLGWRFS